jgi:hypothetical protein
MSRSSTQMSADPDLLVQAFEVLELCIRWRFSAQFSWRSSYSKQCMVPHIWEARCLQLWRVFISQSCQLLELIYQQKYVVNLVNLKFKAPEKCFQLRRTSIIQNVFKKLAKSLLKKLVLLVSVWYEVACHTITVTNFCVTWYSATINMIF